MGTNKAYALRITRLHIWSHNPLMSIIGKSKFSLLLRSEGMLPLPPPLTFPSKLHGLMFFIVAISKFFFPKGYRASEHHYSWVEESLNTIWSNIVLTQENIDHILFSSY